MSASAAALAKADHVPTSQATPENYGDFVLVIDRGRFAMTQSNAKACTWGYGKARFNSGRMDWVYTQGVAPSSHPVQPRRLGHQTAYSRITV